MSDRVKEHSKELVLLRDRRTGKEVIHKKLKTSILWSWPCGRYTYIFWFCFRKRLEAQRFKNSLPQHPQPTGHTVAGSYKHRPGALLERTFKDWQTSVKNWYMFEALWATYGLCCMYFLNNSFKNAFCIVHYIKTIWSLAYESANYGFVGHCAYHIIF